MAWMLHGIHSFLGIVQTLNMFGFGRTEHVQFGFEAQMFGRTFEDNNSETAYRIGFKFGSTKPTFCRTKHIFCQTEPNMAEQLSNVGTYLK